MGRVGIKRLKIPPQPVELMRLEAERKASASEPNTLACDGESGQLADFAGTFVRKHCTDALYQRLGVSGVDVVGEKTIRDFPPVVQ